MTARIGDRVQVRLEPDTTCLAGTRRRLSPGRDAVESTEVQDVRTLAATDTPRHRGTEARRLLRRVIRVGWILASSILLATVLITLVEWAGLNLTRVAE